jgi:hypothetical protein
MNRKPRSNALWGRGGKPVRIVAAGLLVTGGLVIGLASGNASPAGAADCPPLLPPTCNVISTVTSSLPTVTTVTLPGVTTTVTVPGTTTTTSATPAGTQPGATTPPDNATSAGTNAALTYSLRTTVRRLGAKRWIEMRLTLSESATLSARLDKSGHRFAGGRFDARPGANRFRLLIAQRAKSGRYVLTAQLTAGNNQATIRRTITVPRARRG